MTSMRSPNVKTHRDSPSKLPWNDNGSQEEDMLDDDDDSDQDAQLSLKTVTMNRDDVNNDQHLQAQFAEASALWSDENVRVMTRDVQEQGVDWWLREYVVNRKIPPRKLLLAFGLIFGKEVECLEEQQILKILKMTLMRVVRRRARLTYYNTLQDVVHLLKKSRRIMILSGAGISVSSGIPDFRSKNGLYQMLRSSYDYDLDDPQQMFDLEYFKDSPNVFYSFAKEIYPSNHEPSLAHRFIRLLEIKDKLLRNYTQNIDDLESSAGIKTVLQCHGSFAKATCLQCGTQYPGKHIEADVLAQRVPLCTKCPRPQPKPPKKRKVTKTWNGGDETTSEEEDTTFRSVIKPNITFFGEKLSDEFDNLLLQDRSKVDLLIVMGTSLKVTPVSEILCHIPHSVPQILINKTPIRHMNADVILLGNADSIIEYLCSEEALGPGWELPPPSKPTTSKRKSPENKPQPPKRVGGSHVWLFEGAEGGEYVARLEAQTQSPSVKPNVVNGHNGESSRQPKKQRTN